MTDRHAPGVRRRRLSAALKQLRLNTGRTSAEVGEELRWSAGKITRIERNEWKRPSYRDIEDLAKVYGVEGQERDHLLSLAEESRVRSEWQKYQDLFVGPLPEFEAEATRIRTYEALLIPGLLQTPAYAAAVFRGGQIVAPAEMDRKVESRMARRRILDLPAGPRFSGIIDEAALRKISGSREVMEEQLLFLLEMAAHEKVTLQVVTDEAGPHPAVLGAFSLIDFPRPEPSVVYLPSALEPLYVEEVTYTDRYTLVFDLVQGAALSAEDSHTFIADLVDELSK